jgi:FkbM family methyltransferase
MKDYSAIIHNWIKRLRSYGFKNTLRLKKNLKRDCLFSLNFRGHDFFLRGNTVDFNVFNGIFIEKEYDIDLGFNPAIIVDAGANIGASTLYFRLKYPEARIFAIEPEKSNFEILRKNMDNFSSIILENSALWDKDTELSISNPDAEKYAFQMDEKRESGAMVHGMTIESLLKRYDIQGIDLLKLDIEGAERFLFNKEEVPWLKKVRVMIIELHETLYPGTTDIFLNAMEKIDHTLLTRGENTIVFNRSYQAEPHEVS